MSKLRAINDKIIVKRLDAPEKSGSIILPDVAKGKANRGKVVSVGEGKVSATGNRLPMAVHAGNEVIFGNYTGSEIEVDGEKLIIMSQDDVLVIVE